MTLSVVCSVAFTFSFIFKCDRWRQNWQWSSTQLLNMGTWQWLSHFVCVLICTSGGWKTVLAFSKSSNKIMAFILKLQQCHVAVCWEGWSWQNELLLSVREALLFHLSCRCLPNVPVAWSGQRAVIYIHPGNVDFHFSSSLMPASPKGKSQLWLLIKCACVCTHVPVCAYAYVWMCVLWWEWWRWWL